MKKKLLIAIAFFLIGVQAFAVGEQTLSAKGALDQRFDGVRRLSMYGARPRQRVCPAGAICRYDDLENPTQARRHLMESGDVDPKGYLLMRAMGHQQAARRDTRDALGVLFAGLGLLAFGFYFGGVFLFLGLALAVFGFVGSYALARDAKAHRDEARAWAKQARLAPGTGDCREAGDYGVSCRSAGSQDQ
ncbi:MAG: hypothetical protein HYT79_09345 [Elusimicrobia bacterium]|nr:hypothetical protein [Elusimicrobiota bacterium]